MTFGQAEKKLAAIAALGGGEMATKRRPKRCKQCDECIHARLERDLGRTPCLSIYTCKNVEKGMGLCERRSDA